MDWNSAIEDNRRMLKRIVALLFALAGLAERLSGLPRPIRAFVLRILRSAEAVARDFVIETPGKMARRRRFPPASACRAARWRQSCRCDAACAKFPAPGGPAGQAGRPQLRKQTLYRSGGVQHDGPPAGRNEPRAQAAFPRHNAARRRAPRQLLEHRAQAIEHRLESWSSPRPPARGASHGDVSIVAVRRLA